MGVNERKFGAEFFHLSFFLFRAKREDRPWATKQQMQTFRQFPKLYDLAWKDVMLLLGQT